MPSYPFLDHPGPIPFAHRGGARVGLENSMAAFQQAVDLGYRYLETDVVATRDGRLLAFHDRTLDRVTDRTGRISTLSYEEVARARIAGREPLPLLEDVLATWPGVRLNVDVKDWPAVGPLIDVVRRTRSVDRVCVASFSDRRLAAVRRALGPRLATSMGPAAAAALRAAALGRVATGLVPRSAACVQVPLRAGPLLILTRRFVETAHRLGLPVHVWTVDDPAVMHRVLDLGVDGVITDRPETLRQVLLSRGAWRP